MTARPSTARRAGRLLLVAALPLLAAPKCFDYDPRFAGVQADSGPRVDAGPFTPAVPCPTPGEARYRIQNFEFSIQCGCAESSGKSCTIPAGTTVVWTFADSEEHNIAASGGAFPASGDQLAGDFSYTFDSSGTYRYGCSIHRSSMSGYVITVL